LSQVRRLDQIPRAKEIGPADEFTLWQDGRTRVSVIADIITASAGGAAALVPTPTKATVGLALADNTSDAAKAAPGNPVGDAIALASKTAASPNVSFTQAGAGAVAQTAQNKFANVVEPEDFGAVGDGVANDSPAFAKASAALVTQGGGIIQFRRGSNYLIDTTLNLNEGVSIRGYLTGGGLISTDAQGAARLFKLPSRLIVNPNASVSLGNSSTISRVFVIRKGMNGPEPSAALFSGTPFYTGGSDTGIFDSYIVGFARMFYGDGCARNTMNNIKWDCISGPEISNTADVPRWLNMHGWPFGTINAVDPVQGDLNESHFLFRVGPGYKLTGLNDFLSMRDLFTYGHKTGFDISGIIGGGNANVLAVGCSADGLYDISRLGLATPKAPVVLGTVGWKIYNYVDMLMLVGCKGSAQETSIFLDTGPQDGVNNAVTQIVGYQGWGCLNGIKISSGKVVIVSPKFRGIYRQPNPALDLKAAAAGTGVTCSPSGRALLIGEQISGFTLPYDGGGGSGIRVRAPFEVIDGVPTNLRLPTVAFADGLVLDFGADVFKVTAAGTMGSMPVTYPGHRVTFLFPAAASGAQILSGGSFRLNGAFTAGVNSSITLVCTGNGWIETCRSANDTTAATF
jgi:hypothetical protein